MSTHDDDQSTDNNDADRWNDMLADLERRDAEERTRAIAMRNNRSNPLDDPNRTYWRSAPLTPGIVSDWDPHR